MKFKCKGPKGLPEGISGIWQIKTKGDPKYGIYYDTYEGFVVEALTFDQVVSWLKRKLQSNTSHGTYVWTIERVGISYIDRKRLHCLLESYKAG